jgi:hypothetical protein
MVQEPDSAIRLKVYVDRQDNEATLHWARNSYFLVGLSFLVVAYGLSVGQSSGSQIGFHALLVALGLMLTTVWLLVQYRSSQYILYYKTTASRLAQSDQLPDPYPTSLPGFEMRKVAYLLPIIFIIFWSGLGVVLAYTVLC